MAVRGPRRTGARFMAIGSNPISILWPAFWLTPQFTSWTMMSPSRASAYSRDAYPLDAGIIMYDLYMLRYWLTPLLPGAINAGLANKYLPSPVKFSQAEIKRRFT